MLKDLKAHLQGIAALDDLTEIAYGTRSDTTALPSVRLLTVSELPDYTQEGRTSTYETRVQFDVYAKGYHEARHFYQNIVTAMDALREQAVGGTYFICAQQQSNRDREPADLSGGERVYHTTTDFIIRHR